MDFLPGSERFLTGCNYWSSEAGLRMWRDWSEAAVEKDFAALKQCGMNTVRLFPLWPDFQPVQWSCSCGGEHEELVMDDGSSLPECGPGHWGLSEVMLARFRKTADLALKYDLKLIVGLLTGWMSGALLVPGALADKNLFTHPDALYLETLFIRGFVGAMKDHPAIIAWEPGNECNCLSTGSTPVISWNWLNLICTTIRQCDPSRPVYAGMHGSRIDPKRSWNQRILGELTDALTTHPYPAFTPECGHSALNAIPAVYHAPAETLYYRGGSGRPAFVEEIGSFGPAYLSDERTEAYFYTILYSAYAHGLGGVLWWCGFSFGHCSDQLPYRRVAMERELGALDSGRNPAGAARAVRRFRDETASLSYGELPPRRVDALVIATENENMWRAAYGAFILSTQAGFEVEFCDIASRDILPESKFYLVPCITGYNVMELSKYRRLLQAASDGATVCFTADSGTLQPFVSEFGCEVDYCTELPDRVRFAIDGVEGEFQVSASKTRRLRATDCEVLGKDSAGYPVLIRRPYGKGQLIYLNAPIENAAAEADHRLYLIYRKLAGLAGVSCPEKAPEIGITHHPLASGGEIRISINYADRPAGGMAANSVKVERVGA